MSSNTKMSTDRRAINKARAGRWRKNRDHVRGSTQPDLPLTVPNANEKKQAGAKTKRA